MLFSIQPGNSVPSLPLPIAFPNVEQAPPGAVADLRFFDLATGGWRTWGTGTVSADVVRSLTTSVQILTTGKVVAPYTALLMCGGLGVQEYQAPRRCSGASWPALATGPAIPPQPPQAAASQRESKCRSVQSS